MWVTARDVLNVLWWNWSSTTHTERGNILVCHSFQEWPKVLTRNLNVYSVEMIHFLVSQNPYSLIGEPICSLTWCWMCAKYRVLNTTANHPECDGTVERFNRTLKMMQSARFGCQWNKHLPGVLWTCIGTLPMNRAAWINGREGIL